ncbi:MAG: ABC transporter ATP-binding protein [Thermoplasmatales archaeon]|jgi:peptide/nickel transport system ATP-binding protein|nr:ABC transporter ATP-binding protein [Candidatus Thermoplasmatota archaeon]MDA8054481.1 ABC transporter ATP-binding protein [Thermoplasmatales archaeon]
MSGMNTILKVEDLKTQFVSWNGLVKALDGISFEIRSGECLGLVGETGCGKSVTALSIMNLIPETSGAVTGGKITFEDYNLVETQMAACKVIQTKTKPRLKVRRSKIKENSRKMNKIRGGMLSMIFQEPMTTLNPVMTIGEQITDVLYAHQISELTQRIIARKSITEEELRVIYKHCVEGNDLKFLFDFVDLNNGLKGIVPQIEFIINRKDITNYRKKKMISDLFDKDRSVPTQINRLKVWKSIRVPRFLPPLLKQEAEKVAIELLSKVSIPEPTKVIIQYPHELSGGMRQRVVIAIAIACNPHLLIADEPTTALDVTTQAQILDIIKDLKNIHSMSILFITHDLGVISDISDKVAVMYAGNIVEMAYTENLFERPKHPYTQGLLKSIPVYEQKKTELAAIPGSVPNLVHPPEGCRFNPRCDHVMEICRTTKPVMTEVEENHSVACWLYSKKEEK